MEHEVPADIEAAVERARQRAAKTGELRPGSSRSFPVSIPQELADFLQRILTDGTYAQAVERVGREDPNLADI